MVNCIKALNEMYGYDLVKLNFEILDISTSSSYKQSDNKPHLLKILFSALDVNVTIEKC